MTSVATVPSTIGEAINASLPYFACGLMLTQVPRISLQTLNVWRALQVYDAQPTQKHYLIATAPVIKRRWKRWLDHSVAMIIFVSMALLGIAFLSSAFYDDGSRPVLHILRRSIPVAHLSFILSVGFHILARETLADTTWINRLVIFGKPDAAQVNHGVWTRIKTLQGIRLVVLAASITLSYFALCHSGPTALLFALLASSLTVSRSAGYALHGNERISFRIHAQALIITLAACVVVLVIFVALVLGIVYAFDSTLRNSSKEDVSKKEEFWEKFIDICMHDISFRQCVTMAYITLYNGAFPLPVGLIALAYRFDISVSQPDLVVPTTEIKEEALRTSRSIGKQEQHSRGNRNAFDPLGRYKIATNTVEIEQKDVKHIEKPTYRAALFTLVGVLGLCTCALLVWDRKLEALRIPTSSQEARMMSENLYPLTILMAYAFAWPFIIVAMAVSAWSRGGQSRLRQLWKYEESWKCEHDALVSGTEEKTKLINGEDESWQDEDKIEKVSSDQGAASKS